MRIVNYTKGMEINLVGARYVANGVAIDCTAHFYSTVEGDINDLTSFGLGTEFGEDVARDLLDSAIA